MNISIDQKLVEEPFALSGFEKKISKQEKPYLDIRLSDKTGEIRGKVWFENIKNCDNDLKIGDIVRVTGFVQEFTGKPQLILSSIKKFENAKPEEFLPVTDRDRSELKNFISEEIEKTRNEHLKKLLNIFWQNENLRDQYVNHPAAMYVHHGYIGGLLEHVYEMTKLSEPYLNLYDFVDRDLLFVGIFFHDVGKLEELEVLGAIIDMSYEGNLIGHITQGVLIVTNLMDSINEFPKDLKEKVIHMIISHQGEIEKGSPVKPKTIEAIILSRVDDDSSYMNQVMCQIKKESNPDSKFTEYNPRLQRSILLPN